MNIPTLTYMGRPFIYKEGGLNPIDPLYTVDKPHGEWKIGTLGTYSGLMAYRENFHNDVFATRQEAEVILRCIIVRELNNARKSIPVLEAQLRQLDEPSVENKPDVQPVTAEEPATDLDLSVLHEIYNETVVVGGTFEFQYTLMYQPQLEILQGFPTARSLDLTYSCRFLDIYVSVERLDLETSWDHFVGTHCKKRTAGFNDAIKTLGIERQLVDALKKVKAPQELINEWQVTVDLDGELDVHQNTRGPQ